MSHKIRSIATAGCLAVAVLAVPLATASPASATTAQCKDYLKREGYNVGPKVTSACKRGASGWHGNPFCQLRLTNIGVRSDHAVRACDYASW